MSLTATYGDAQFTRHYPDNGPSYITCDRADPRIAISDVLLHQIASGEDKPWAVLMLPDGTTANAPPPRPRDWFGAVLRVDCANRQLVYRITGFEPVWLEDPGIGTYLAEWPD